MVAGISGTASVCAAGSGEPPPNKPPPPVVHPENASTQTTAATGGERRVNIPIEAPPMCAARGGLETITARPALTFQLRYYKTVNAIAAPRPRPRSVRDYPRHPSNYSPGKADMGRGFDKDYVSAPPMDAGRVLQAPTFYLALPEICRGSLSGGSTLMLSRFAALASKSASAKKPPAWIPSMAQRSSTSL